MLPDAKKPMLKREWLSQKAFNRSRYFVAGAFSVKDLSFGQWRDHLHSDPLNVFDRLPFKKKLAALSNREQK